MYEIQMNDSTTIRESSEILESKTLVFEENSVAEEAGSGDYSCKCISQETCCGCFIQ